MKCPECGREITRAMLIGHPYTPGKAVLCDCGALNEIPDIWADGMYGAEHEQH